MLKKILGIMMAALFLVNAGIAPVNAAEVPNMEEKSGDIKRSDLEPGWVANIYAYSKGDNVSQLPVAAMGSFKADASSYKVNDYVKSLGFPIQDKSIGWQGQAYIVAEKKGHYVFALNLISDSNYGSIFVDGKQIAQGHSGSIVGAIELEPGVHTLEFRYINTVWNLKAGGFTRESRGFELRIKSPTDNAPVLAEKVLFRKK